MLRRKEQIIFDLHGFGAAPENISAGFAWLKKKQDRPEYAKYHILAFISRAQYRIMCNHYAAPDNPPDLEGTDGNFNNITFKVGPCQNKN